MKIIITLCLVFVACASEARCSSADCKKDASSLVPTGSARGQAAEAEEHVGLFDGDIHIEAVVNDDSLIQPEEQSSMSVPAKSGDLTAWTPGDAFSDSSAHQDHFSPVKQLEYGGNMTVPRERKLAAAIRCAAVSEHDTAYLTCPFGFITTIMFASYGTPEGGCGSYYGGWCHAGSSFSTVSSWCLHQSSCAIAASNGIFGDPCVGTFKRMYIQVSCGYCDPAAVTPFASTYQLVSGYTYTWTCNAGYYGSTVTRTWNPTTDGWSGSATTCYACGSGYYCPGNGYRYACGAGVWANPAHTTLTSSVCSGYCTAGYYCPAGSTSPTQNECGGYGDLYCPAGAGSPTRVAANYYTTPLDASLKRRSGQAICPTSRLCVDGLIQPALTMAGGSACESGLMYATLNEAFTNADFSSAITVTTPGYSGSLGWTIHSVRPNAVACSVPTSQLRTRALDTRSAVVGIGAPRVNYATCSQGFIAQVRTYRTEDTSLFIDCNVDITLTQEMRAPTITNCGARSVTERLPVGSSAGAAFAASNPNVGTTIRWSISANPYFGIDGCSGQVFTTSVIFWKSVKYVDVVITSANDGSMFGLPTVTTTCSSRITIIEVNDPPIVWSTALYHVELTPAGTVVGTVNVTDPNGDIPTNYMWTVRDAGDPFAFAIASATGLVTVTKELDSLKTLKTVYTYDMSVSDGRGGTTTQRITIFIQQVPRPPVVYDQSRSISEAAAPGSSLPPAIIATHPQGLPLTFSIAPASVFAIHTSSGILSLRIDQQLNFLTQATYALSLTVLDPNGMTATAKITVNVTEVNKPPYFQGPDNTAATGPFIGMAEPGWLAGTGLPIQLAAVDLNRRDVLTYAITSMIPAVGYRYFTLDASSGALRYAYGMPSGNSFQFDWTVLAEYPRPRTFVMNFSVTDSGTPRLTTNATAYIEVITVAPKIDPQTWAMAGNGNVGTLIGRVAALSAYAQSNLTYAIQRNDPTPSGDVPFAINAATGDVTVRQVCYGSPTVCGAPRWDYNLKPVHQIIVAVTDRSVSPALTSTNTITINLMHVNRAPTWLAVPRMFAKAASSGIVGTPLRNFVVDPDVSLSIGENLTFSIVSGNVQNTFTLDAATGQISVHDNNTVALQYPNGVGVFNITVRVRDLGINGPSYTADALVQIEVTDANIMPQLPAFGNFTVPEHSALGTVIGAFAGSDRNLDQMLTYSIAARGQNVNRPFPFGIRTLATGQGIGQLYVIDDGPIDWNTLFKVYYATITVTDNHPAAPLSTSAPIEIWVQWVAEPPFFAETRVPNSKQFIISVDEHSAPLTNVSSSGLLASSKDPWQRPLLRYSWLNPSGLDSIFAIHPVTAMVTLAASAPDLVFNIKPQYNMTIRCVDTNGLVDTALVTINIRDINDIASWSGLYDANMRIANKLSVSEDAPVGTVFGYVNASDPDKSQIWGARRYGIVPSLSASVFGINQTSGALFVAVAGMDFWDQTNCTLNVSCSDADPTSPLFIYRQVIIELVQVNTVRIDGFAVPVATLAANGANVSTSAYASSHASMDVLLNTVGGTVVRIFGRGFGRTARRLQAESLTSSATRVRASYGPTGVEYNATACAVVQPNTLVECTTVAGIGINHKWTLIVDNLWTAKSIAQTGFFPPSIDSVIVTGVVNGSAAAQVLDTLGTSTVDVRCRNCGPIGTVVQLVYGRTVDEYRSPSCQWVISQDLLRCATTPGIGKNLLWRISVGSQQSAIFNQSVVHYAPPTIQAVSAPLMDTMGAQTDVIVINGTMFGPANTREIIVQYSVDFTRGDVPVYTATNCYTSPSLAHRTIVCTNIAGIGKKLRVVVSVGGQWSGLSAESQALSYRPPSIIDIAGLGADNADTIGGQEIVLYGQQFGPETPLDAGGFPYGWTQPGAFYGTNEPLTYTAAGCRVSVAHKQMICTTVPGVGRDLAWQVVVGDQVSTVFTNRTTSYHPPIVSSYMGPGADQALTSGDQSVTISGRNFGPLGTIISVASYGRTGTEFTARNCIITKAHEEVQCYTTIGAGAGLVWFLTIGAQRSVAPSTNYGPPRILGFHGAGAQDANTDGGDAIVIRGEFLSVQSFLDKVTYGASGTEYIARDCIVTVNHTEITCHTVPGTGRKLHWLVTVAGQQSALSSRTTSYAAPSILRVIPPNAPTDGGTTVRIEGENFALSHSAARISIKLNARGLVTPERGRLDAYWDATLAGDTVSNDEASKWVAELPTFLPVSVSTLSRGNHSITFTLPEGFGHQRELFVVVDGVPSAIVPFMYDAPFIANVAPDRQNVTIGNLRVFIEGRSFCNGLGGCGVVKVNGVAYNPVVWTNSLILIIIPDLPMNAPPAIATVEVDGIASNEFAFKKPVPNIDLLEGQGSWVNMKTEGGELFYINGVRDIGQEPINITISNRLCSNITRTVTNGLAANDQNAVFTVYCTTPPGVGLRNPIIVTSLGGSSRSDGSFVFSYAAPIIRSFYLSGHSRLLQTGMLPTLPTLGAEVVIEGENLGTPDLGVGLLSLDNSYLLNVTGQTHERVTAQIPQGDGTGHFLQYLVGDQVSIPLFFNYTAPTLLSISPDHGPTVGGTIVNLTGTNFGVSVPVIFIGGRLCSPVASGYRRPSETHGLVSCVAPKNQGKGHVVEIISSGQSSFLTVPRASTTVLFGYDPPQVFSVVPATGPTSGRHLGALLTDGLHRAGGERVVMSLHGYNLGTNGTIEFRPHSRSEPAALRVIVDRADIISHNDTLIQFYQPEGFGDSLHVFALISNQQNAEEVEFVYEPPSVVGTGYFSRLPAECAPREACFVFGERTLCKMAPAGCWDTRGDSPLEIIGENFGPPAVRGVSVITINGKTCERVATAPQDHNRIVCKVPRGMGDVNPIVVTVGSRQSPLNNATNFAYDPPVVTHAMPNTPDARGVEPVLLKGKNFGFEASPVSMNVSELPCVQVEWLNDATIKCVPQPDVVGSKNVSVLGAIRKDPAVFFDFEEFWIAECKSEYYGLDGEPCLPCPIGATCPGSERYTDLVYSKPGFWRENLTVNAEIAAQKCEPLRLTSAPRQEWGCAYFSACEPQNSCKGNNTCADGYTGLRCMFCLQGKYYRLNGECVKCPDSPFAIIIGAALGLIAIAGAGYYLNKKRISIALIAIGVDYFQIVSMFARTKILWPAAVKELFNIMSAFNLNLEIVAPECMVPNVSFSQKWFFIEAMPLGLFGLFLVVYSIKLAYRATCTSASKRELNSHYPTIISTFIVLFRVLYLYLTRTSMDVMNCMHTEPSDGKTYMSGLLDVPCWESGSTQVFLFPFALAALGLYTLALPAGALWFLRANKDIVKYDQILRAKGLGDNFRENPSHFQFRKTWSKLYYHYKPGKWYWEGVITLRKALIAFTSLMFRNSASYQLALALLVLFTAFVLHTKHMPYLTHADKPKIVADHLLKAQTDRLHASIEADMRAVVEKNFRKGYKSQKAFDTSKLTRNKLDSAAFAAFDYNTVESVMLASAVLINLAGIMFSSARFAGDGLKLNRNEYDSLTYGVMILIFGTVVYYVLTFVTDLLVICNPEAAASMLNCSEKIARCRGKSTPQAHALKGQKHAVVNPLVGDEPHAVSLVVNPFLMQSLTRNKEEAGFDISKGIVSQSELQSSGSLPDPVTWARVKNSYKDLVEAVEKLQHEVRDLRKHKALDGSGVGNENPADRVNALASRSRKKNEFAPQSSIGPNLESPLIGAGDLDSVPKPARTKSNLAFAMGSKPVGKIASFRRQQKRASTAPEPDESVLPTAAPESPV